ncbi:hypothetical protein SODALDRAFT_331970 [Sodiomyces alkalinus F11]|uniref:Uncharacterized protein n=1 Tax=Sodiomyces alkalinus (strain CBS 110278 / VKM F-3762 / F11) TaxID=1314773 RepID=A0A3N2PZB2_SODAK|nr:hypothetical protein SODALDRAFT_331970 [Sodiomyces alkalinus F11]ROT39844.1 hypothetical protein SODALDRAFT_331970 [Sodiomyces alkalinus F11]
MDTKPLRVCARASQRSEEYTTAWEKPDNLIETTIEAMKEQNIPTGTPNLVAVQQLDLAIFVVFDLFYHDYDPRLGHLAQFNNLPVCEVVFKRGKVRAAMSSAERARYVNDQIRTFHILNGQEGRPPFREDLSKGQRAHYGAPRETTGSS